MINADLGENQWASKSVVLRPEGFPAVRVKLESLRGPSGETGIWCSIGVGTPALLSIHYSSSIERCRICRHESAWVSIGRIAIFGLSEAQLDALRTTFGLKEECL